MIIYLKKVKVSWNKTEITSANPGQFSRLDYEQKYFYKNRNVWKTSRVTET